MEPFHISDLEVYFAKCIPLTHLLSFASLFSFSKTHMYGGIFFICHILRYLSSITAVLLTLKLGSAESQKASLICPLLYHATISLCQYCFVRICQYLFVFVSIWWCFLVFVGIYSESLTQGRLCSQKWINFRKTSKRLFAPKICNEIFWISMTPPPFPKIHCFFPKFVAFPPQKCSFIILKSATNFFGSEMTPLPFGSFPKIPQFL